VSGRGRHHWRAGLQAHAGPGPQAQAPDSESPPTCAPRRGTLADSESRNERGLAEPSDARTDRATAFKLITALGAQRLPGLPAGVSES
jgi:hypothetical protein